ncbi:F-box protein SKIP23-like [Olea europaea var. sylvestris]|uniref:F-box protein SKIP23-like n=1 Tax=Olea europaea var. sylvestris TaxID=158386 RepID=UPI000C1D2E8E|nr:F-box protein SKIP23-like [Olea europaea var. sylvestris]XP_022876073.1 F-box protein SKIP23-like [Olea europaea var. sylvestris]XP_022876074.1 F-box protein SKIP23-like [Olea europaea var. sylvestris]
MSTTIIIVDWSELTPELLQTIAGNLRRQADHIRFRAVCSSWRAAAPLTPRHLPREFPWLMLRPSRSALFPHRRAFLNALSNKLHLLTLPEASLSRRRVGSSHGWLILNDESPSIFLINPITRAKVNLPAPSTFPNVLNFDFYSVGGEYTLRSPGAEVYTCSLRKMRDSFIKKVILSHNPYNDSNFTALAILNWHGDLAYCEKGENSWKFIDEARSYCEDVIYFNDSFYAVNKFGSIAICDVKDADCPKVSFIKMQQQIGGDMQYLVDAMGELLLITRYLELDTDSEHLEHQSDNVYKTVKFCVWRLDLSGPKWERIMTLGDRVLFLGENSSLAILATDYPGCKGNRIYFADDYSEANYDGNHGISGDHDVGFYNLEDGSIEPLPFNRRISHWPIWITPNPC